MTEKTRRRVRRHQRRGALLGDTLDPGKISLPIVERHDDVDVAAEGLDAERLTQVGKTSDSVGAGPDTASFYTDDSQMSTESDDRSAVADSAMQPERQSESESISADSIPDQDNSNLQAQLDRIEAAVTGQQARARVVDAGDDVTLLRVIDEQLADELTHGELVSLTVTRIVSTTTPDNANDE